MVLFNARVEGKSLLAAVDSPDGFRFGDESNPGNRNETRESDSRASIAVAGGAGERRNETRPKQDPSKTQVSRTLQESRQREGKMMYFRLPKGGG
jgi:hypothetical protein